MNTRWWIALLFLSAFVVPNAGSSSDTTSVVVDEGRPAAPGAVITLNPIADAYVYSADPDKNFGSAASLEVGGKTAGVKSRALFR